MPAKSGRIYRYERYKAAKLWTVTSKIERRIRAIHALSFEHGTLAFAIQQAVDEAEARGWHTWT